MNHTIEEYRDELASGGHLHLKCIQLYSEEPGWTTPRSLDRPTSKQVTVSTGTRNILKALERRVRHSNHHHHHSSKPIKNESYEIARTPQLIPDSNNLSLVEPQVMTHHLTRSHRSPIELTSSSLNDIPFPTSSLSHSCPSVEMIISQDDQLELQLREIEQFLREDVEKS